MAVLLEQSSVESLVSFREVSVVQSIDVQALQKLLTRLGEGQAAAQAQIQCQQQEIDALKAGRQQETYKHLEGGSSNGQVDAAEAAAPSSSYSTSSAQQPDAAAPHHTLQDGSALELRKQLANLTLKIQQLEVQMAAASAVPATSGAAAEAPTFPAPAPAPAPSTAPATAATASSLPHSSSLSKQRQQQQQQASDTSAGLQALQQQQALLASQLASLKASLAAAVGDCAQHLQDGLAGKADAAGLQALLQGLSSKAEGRDLEQLRQQLAGKADRAELDAVLSSMAGVGVQSGGDKDGSSAGSSGGDSTTAAAGNRGGAEVANAAQMSKLQLQLALLQERINSKADTAAVADINYSLAATRQELVQLQLSIQQMQAQVAADHTAIADIKQARQQQSQQQQQSTTPASVQGLLLTPAAAAAAAGIDINMAVQLQELPMMLVRLSAVEPSLASAAAATQTAAAATAHCRSTSSNAGNGSSSNTRAIAAEPGVGADGAQVASVAAQVASLQAQVAQLLQARAAVSRSNSNSRSGMAPGRRSSQQAPQQAFEVVAAADSSLDEAEDTTEAGSDCAIQSERAVPADANDAATDASAGVMAALTELSERVVELQAQLDGLAAAKADRGELQQMRGALAETAAQNDMEVLRHKLHSQQQQVARLAQQLISSSAAGDAGSAHAVTGHSSNSRSPGSAEWDSSSSGADTAAGAEASAEVCAAQTVAGADVAGSAAGSVPSLRQQPPAGCNDNAITQQQSHLGTAELQQQLQQQLAGLELLAEAVSLLATGQAAATGAAGASTADLTDGHSSFTFAAGGHAAAAATTVKAGGAGETQITSEAVPGAQLLRLQRLLQTGQVGHKMDWFDPVLLQKMAQRLAATEALIKMQPHAGGAAGAAGTGGDVEGRLKRLAADVRMLKERTGDAAAMGAVANGSRSPGQGGWGMRGDGDHTMLAAKPLGGYRCMACDRPLGSLDASPGPHLPTGLMPVSLPNGAEMALAAGAALGKLPPAAAGGRRTTMQEVVSVPAPARGGDQPSLSPAGSPEPGAPNRRVTGPQNWYAQAHGLPGEQLPKGDVGPHLPPGGWRGSLPRAEDGSVLPALVARGGGGGGVGLPGTAPGGRQ